MNSPLDNLHINDVHFLVFDYETLNPYGMPPQPIEIGAVVVAPTLSHQPQRNYQSFIKPHPDVPFTPFTTELTGITPEHLEDSDDASTVMREFNLAFADQSYILVAHNAHYDLGILRQFKAECPGLLSLACIDTVRLAKRLVPELPNRKLDTLISHFELEMPEDRHRALTDSVLTAGVLIRLLEIAQTKGIFSATQLLKLSGIKRPSPVLPATKALQFDI